MIEEDILNRALQETRQNLLVLKHQYRALVSSDDEGMVRVSVTFSCPEKYHALESIAEKMSWISRIERVARSCGISVTGREGIFIMGKIPHEKIQNAVNELGKKYHVRIANEGYFFELSDMARLSDDPIPHAGKRLSDRSVRRP